MYPNCQYSFFLRSISGSIKRLHEGLHFGATVELNQFCGQVDLIESFSQNHQHLEGKKIKTEYQLHKYLSTECSDQTTIRRFTIELELLPKNTFGHRKNPLNRISFNAILFLVENLVAVFKDDIIYLWWRGKTVHYVDEGQNVSICCHSSWSSPSNSTDSVML